MKQQLRIQIRNDNFRPNFSAIVQYNTDRATVANQYAGHCCIERNFHATLGGFLRHRLRDGAHTSDGVSPDTGLAVNLTKYVVKQHVS